MKTIPIIRIRKGNKQRTQDIVAEEVVLKLVVNGQPIDEFSCSGDHVSELVMGYLYVHDYLTLPGDILSLEYSMDEETAFIHLKKTTPSYLDGLVGVQKSYPVDTVFAHMGAFVNLSGRFQKTGAVHTAAIADENSIRKSFDDLSRHNTLLMLLGHSMMQNVPLSDKMLLLTCRLTKSIMDLILKTGVRIVVTKGAPTWRAVQICIDNDIALAGFVRGDRMNLYHGEERFTIDPENL